VVVSDPCSGVWHLRDTTLLSVFLHCAPAAPGAKSVVSDYLVVDANPAFRLVHLTTCAYSLYHLRLWFLDARR